ncbi:MAG: CBS domain-containing protein [Methylobacter sp.]|nr:CBS domain-containing protein [Methylobacter sp.]
MKDQYPANIPPMQGGQKIVRDIMTRNPVTVSVGLTLALAAERMETLRISCLLIEEAGKIIGILTERDVLRSLNQKIPITQTVDTVMTREVICIKETEERHAAYHTMALHGFRHLLVVDDEGKPTGVITETDFRKNYGIENFIGILNVARMMSQGYFGMRGDSLAMEASTEMQTRNISCVVVLEQRKPIGIVTERDMVRLFRLQKLDLRLAEVMTAPVHSVTPDMLLIDAVAKMQTLKIRRFVVVDESGDMIGILNEHDIVRHLEDEYIDMLQQLVIKQAQKLNDDKFRAVVNHLPHKIMVKNTNSVYVSCNDSYAHDLDIQPEDIEGKTDFDFFPRELAERYRADDRTVMSEQTIISIEEPYIKDGKQHWIHTTKIPMLDSQSNVNGVVVIFHDVTEEKRNAEKLKRRSWALEALRRSGRALVFSETEAELLQAVCDAITLQDIYVLAWFGWAEQNELHSVKITATSGTAHGYLDEFSVNWGHDKLGNGPTGRAIRSGRTMVNNNLSENPDFSPWQQKAKDFGIQSSVSLPVMVDERVAGVLTVYSKELSAFGDSEISLFEELASNLGFGIQSRRTRAAYEKSLQERAAQAIRLEKLLEDTLTTVAATLEQRDPYTAGHQTHVADLATNIGREMGFDENRLLGLHLAATVHDLGKIHIPAEILAKPGRLTAAEFGLVKTHPEVGYNILSKIDFPWPIAEVIRQHHEYLDGSGYPRGLKGDEILLEARIITVADIVESMSSDRPYRPALGIDVAMQEILTMRGSKLDSEVVNVCLKVIDSGKFLPNLL